MKWSSIETLGKTHQKSAITEWMKKIWFKPTESDPFRICEKICEAPRNGQECANIWTEKSWNGFDDMQMRPFRSVGNVKSNSMKNETGHNILCYSNSNMKMKRTVNVRKNGRIRWKPHTFIQLMIILHAFQWGERGCALIHQLGFLHPISHEPLFKHTQFADFGSCMHSNRVLFYSPCWRLSLPFPFSWTQNLMLPSHNLYIILSPWLC